MRCRYCGTINEDHAKVCKHCGHPFVFQKQKNYSNTAQRAVTHTHKGVNFCPNCGLKLEEEVEFCPRCGKLVNEQKVCPHCGAKNSEHAQFCKMCGKDLSAAKVMNKENYALAVREEIASDVKKQNRTFNQNLVLSLSIIFSLFFFIVMAWTELIGRSGPNGLSNGIYLSDYFSLLFHLGNYSDSYAHNVYLIEGIGVILSLIAMFTCSVLGIVNSIMSITHNKKPTSMKYVGFNMIIACSLYALLMSGVGVVNTQEYTNYFIGFGLYLPLGVGAIVYFINAVYKVALDRKKDFLSDTIRKSGLLGCLALSLIALILLPSSFLSFNLGEAGVGSFYMQVLDSLKHFGSTPLVTSAPTILLTNYLLYLFLLLSLVASLILSIIYITYSKCSIAYYTTHVLAIVLAVFFIISSINAINVYGIVYVFDGTNASINSFGLSFYIYIALSLLLLAIVFIIFDIVFKIIRLINGKKEKNNKADVRLKEEI